MHIVDSTEDRNLTRIGESRLGVVSFATTPQSFAYRLILAIQTYIIAVICGMDLD